MSLILLLLLIVLLFGSGFALASDLLWLAFIILVVVLVLGYAGRGW